MDCSQVRVLLVARDNSITEQMARELEGRGYTTRCCSTAHDAIRELRGDEPPVDVVVLDIALGNEMSRSAASEVALAQGRLAVVALASQSDREADLAPDFACHAYVARDSGAAVVDAALRTALRVFEQQRQADDRRADLEVAASEARIGLWEYDPQSSLFHGSSIVRQILGLDDDAEVDLETVSTLYGTDSSGTLDRAVDLALTEGKPFSLISEIRTTSGQRRWIRTQGQRSGQPGSRSAKVIGTVQDISEIRLLDRVTQQSEMTLSQVEEITHIGHWSVSLTDGSIYHSDEIKRIFGYEPSEYALSVEEAIDAYHPDDRDEVVRLFNRAAETGEGYEFDLRIVQPSGDVRHVHSKGYTEQQADGNVTRVYGVFQDITERLRSERALRESEAAMKALVDGVRTAIVVHGRDGEVLLSNRMADRLLAPLATEVVGKELGGPAWRFIDEDGREVPVDELPVSRILTTLKPVDNLVLGRRDGDGVAWMLINGVPVVDKNGALSKIIISFVDITEHRQVEERLHQSEKMKAIGQLAGGVAHDFNNQLMVIGNFAELLTESLDEDPQARSFASEILQAVSRSAELTNQLLAFARKGKFVVTTVDINSLISEVVSITGHSFDKKIRITHKANVEPATIAGDPSLLQNALLNIALNARDAMPSGGDLTFTTDRVTLDEQSLKRMGPDVDPGECLRVSIRDTGIGMDDVALKHVFEPFFTTKEPGKGTGMGMASVYGTVKSHLGAIEVESEPGAGTTITLHFPLVAGEVDRADKPVARGKGTGGRILIIDDEQAVASSLSMVLSRQGYETTTCATGRDAVDEFRKSWRSTDLVLLDMIMPETSGLEVFHALKAIDPEVKVVLISGHSFTDEAKKISEEGATGLLLKPVAAGELLRTISEVLGTQKGQG